MAYSAMCMETKPHKQPQRSALHVSPAAMSLRTFCRNIMECGDLETKLRAPDLPEALSELPDDPSGPALLLERPVRNPELAMGPGSDALPRPGQLKDVVHRRSCLARFAHHELQAVEYFAWALLRWPEMPALLRRGLLSALIDEQRHCRLYLDRLYAQGGEFETGDHSDYFWRQAPAIAASPAGPRAFLSAMGLTLEQANLDFTLTYRDGFAEAGDAETAAVCQRVHDEEVAHVALAARWLKRLEADQKTLHPDDVDDLTAYVQTVPFPMGPARAKGRRFDVGARKRAGLSDAMIEAIRVARSTQENPSGAPLDAPIRNDRR